MRRVAALGVVALVVGLIAGCGGGSSADTDTSVPFDRAFIDAMVPHHESAIAMAKEAVAAGLQEPELLLITDAILADQEREIEQMKQWRAAWYGSSEIDPDGAAALGMTDDEMGMGHAAGSFAGADDVDAAFAAAMIMHHQGAIVMAERASGRAEHPELEKLAASIVSSQAAEVERMRPYAVGAEGHEGMEGM